MDLRTHKVICKKCGQIYVVATGYPMTAPHGPNKDCPSSNLEYYGPDSLEL